MKASALHIHKLISVQTDFYQTAHLSPCVICCHCLLKHVSCISNDIASPEPQSRKKIRQMYTVNMKVLWFPWVKFNEFLSQIVCSWTNKTTNSNDEGQGQHLGELSIYYKIIISQYYDQGTKINYSMCCFKIVLSPDHIGLEGTWISCLLFF